MEIFKLLVLSHMHTTLYKNCSLSLYSKKTLTSSILCESTKKFESTNMVLARFKILICSTFSSMGVWL